VVGFDTVNLEQTFPIAAPKWRGARKRKGIMTIAKGDKLKDYARYAEHCLNMPATTNKEADIQSEMAAEWLKLADAILHPLKRMA